MGGGTYSLPEQLAGPSEALPGVILYPPVFALVVLPFLFLPWWVYWAFPIAAVVFAMNRHHQATSGRRSPLLWFPGTIVILVAGNPVMLMVGALALGTIWAWPSVFVLFKPSLGLFALFGIWRRGWWVALGVLVLVSLPFAGAWLDYVTVLRNVWHPLGLLSIGQVPTMSAPDRLGGTFARSQFPGGGALKADEPVDPVRPARRTGARG